MALLLLLGCGVIAAAVGLQVWGTAGPAASALRTGAIGGAPSRSGDPMFDLVSDSSTGIDGPSGTWKQWGDLGSQRRSIAPAAEPARSSTTTFPDVNGGGARVQRASETTTTTTP